MHAPPKKGSPDALPSTIRLTGGRAGDMPATRARTEWNTGEGHMNRPRAPDDFATIRARLDQLRREREQAHAGEGELHRDPQTYRARDVRWTASEIDAGPGRVRQSA
jgi:hypothetical protein